MQIEKTLTVTGLMLLLGAGWNSAVIAAPMTGQDVTVSEPATAKQTMPPAPPGPYRPVPAVSPEVQSFQTRGYPGANRMPPSTLPPASHYARPPMQQDWQAATPVMPVPPRSRWQPAPAYAPHQSGMAPPQWQGAAPAPRPMPSQVQTPDPRDQGYGQAYRNPPQYAQPAPQQNWQGRPAPAQAWGYAPAPGYAPAYPQGPVQQNPTQAGRGRHWQAMPPQQNWQPGTAPGTAAPDYGQPPRYEPPRGYGYPPQPPYPPQPGYAPGGGWGYGQRPY